MASIRTLTRRKCSPQEIAFAHAFAACLDAPQAASSVGYSDPSHDGPKLLRRPRVRRLVDRLVSKRIPGPREVLGEIADLAMSPDERFAARTFNDQGKVLSERVALSPKVEALKMLAQHHGVTADPLTRVLADLVGVEVRRIKSQDEKDRNAIRYAARRRGDKRGRHAHEMTRDPNTGAFVSERGAELAVLALAPAPDTALPAAEVDTPPPTSADDTAPTSADLTSPPPTSAPPTTPPPTSED